MPDVTLHSVRLGVIGAFASAAALDALRAPASARACRVAADELALVCAAVDAPTLLATVAGQLASADPHGLALDMSDGWTAFSLEGEIERAFSYLSELALPAPGGFVQGDVLRVPVRVLTHAERIDLLVPSPWGEYLHGELRESLRALDLREASGAR